MIDKSMGIDKMYLELLVVFRCILLLNENERIGESSFRMK